MRYPNVIQILISDSSWYQTLPICAFVELTKNPQLIILFKRINIYRFHFPPKKNYIGIAASTTCRVVWRFQYHRRTKKHLKTEVGVQSWGQQVQTEEAAGTSESLLAHLVTSANPAAVLKYKVILPQAQLGHSSHLFSHMLSLQWPRGAEESLRCESEAWNAAQDEMFTRTVFPFFLHCALRVSVRRSVESTGRLQ